MAFELPALPYSYDALGPYMSAETLEFHHDKHHQAYVNNGNKLLEGSGLEGKGLEDVVKESFGKNAGLFNNAAQHYNHLHFWKWMAPNGGGTNLPGKVQQKIDSDLGGYDKFKADFLAAGAGQFGSGWAWLALKGRQARSDEDAERRKPARSRRHAAARRRCLGALLLHRLPQRPSEVSRGLRRQPDQLGLCRGTARGSVLAPSVAPPTAGPNCNLRKPGQRRGGGGGGAFFVAVHSQTHHRVCSGFSGNVNFSLTTSGSRILIAVDAVHIAIVSPNPAFSAFTEAVLASWPDIEVEAYADVDELDSARIVPAVIACNFEFDSGFYQRAFPKIASLRQTHPLATLALVRRLDGWTRSRCTSIGIDEVLIKPVSPLHLGLRLAALATGQAPIHGESRHSAEILPFPTHRCGGNATGFRPFAT